MDTLQKSRSFKPSDVSDGILTKSIEAGLVEGGISSRTWDVHHVQA